MDTRPNEPESIDFNQPLYGSVTPDTAPTTAVPDTAPLSSPPVAPVAPTAVPGAPVVPPAVAPTNFGAPAAPFVPPAPPIPQPTTPLPQAIPLTSSVVPPVGVGQAPAPSAPLPSAAPTAPAPMAQATAPVATGPQQKKPSSGPKVWLSVLIAALVSALVGGLVAAGVTAVILGQKPWYTSPISAGSNSGSTINVKSDGSTTLSEAVAQKVLPSVVSITVSAQTQANPFTGGGTTETEQDSGSGVIIKADGYILTNNHVIDGGDKIVVNAGGKDYTATVVGADADTDIAVLKISATGLPAIDIGTSSNLKVGQYVMAIGCPFGLEKSVSTGIISGLGRSDLMATQSSVTAYTDLIQTDAAINPGNSGGALVDQNGHLIGINALINSTSGSSAGVGFAIPVDTALDIANQIMTTGKVVHPFLGVSTQSVTSEIAQAYKMPVDVGAYIVDVSAGSPAEAAGLKKNDIITAIDGKKISSSEDVFTQVRSHKVGDEITITYYRDDKQQTASAKLASDAQNQASQQNNTQQNSNSGSGSGSGSGSTTNPHNGYTPQELYDLLQQYGLGGGNGSTNNQ